MSDTQAQADDRRAQIQARLDAVKQAYRDGGLNVLVKPSHLASWDDIEWLLAERDRLSRQLDKAQAEATDWQLAADGIKHHFGCANNVVTGNPNGHICDRCRAEAAEAELSRLSRVEQALREALTGLAVTWRDRAAKMSDVPVGLSWAHGVRLAERKCADELDALLSASPSSQPTEQ